MDNIEIKERVITDIKLPFKRALYLVAQFALAQLVISLIIGIPVVILLLFTKGG